MRDVIDVEDALIKIAESLSNQKKVSLLKILLLIKVTNAIATIHPHIPRLAQRTSNHK